MSTTYTPTRNPYDPENWPSWIVMPNDGDPFNALSANNFEKPLLDRSQLVFEAALKRTYNSLPIRAFTPLGQTIYLGVYSSLQTLNSSYEASTYSQITSITDANIEPAGIFQPSTRYYVYLKQNTDGTTKIVVKTDPPHISLLYRDNAGAQDLQYKYLLTFATDGFSGIRQFRKNGKFNFLQNFTRVLNRGTASTYTFVDLSAFIPSFASHVILNLTFFNGSTTANSSAAIENGLNHINISGAKNTTSDSTTYTQQYIMPVNVTTRGFIYIVSPTTPASNLTVDFVGYCE